MEKWLAELAGEDLTNLLEERALPQAAGYTRITTFGQLADHLLSDASVERGLGAISAGEAELLASVAVQALELHGPVAAPPERPAYGLKPVTPTVIEPFERLVPQADVLKWLEMGGASRERVEASFDRLRARGLLLSSPRGQLALPQLLHVRAASLDGYGRPAEQLLASAYNAPEIKRIAAALGLGEKLTRGAAQELIVALLTDEQRVQGLVAGAPQRARELLDLLVPGPPLLRTHCFVSRYSNYAGPEDKFVFREGGSG
ncbi:hypothetical protein AB0G49_36170, partial [Streptomyces longwoodensis]